MAFEIGSTVGDYQIIGILGAGGMGKVYKVRNVISDRIEAMKVLLPDLAGAPDLADRFLREIKVQASLEHPNIAALHTALRAENQLVMLMEFVEGMSLDTRIKNGPLPPAEAANYIGQVLAALSYAHQRGVIHRDIKPANMMLTASGTVKLMDFGIAKAAADRKLTMTGTTMGSLYYMSPEQIKGEQTLDARSDLYSVGVSLYELVTGRHPFDGDSQFAIMSAHLEGTPAPPITLDPRVPQALNDVILLAVGKDPGKRFQTAEAFRNALLSTVAAQPAPAPAPRPVQAAPPPPPPPTAHKSHRGLWLAAGALVTALVVVGLIQLAPWRKTAASTPPVVTETPAPATQAPATQAPVTAAPVTQTAAPVTQAPPPETTAAPVKPAVAEPRQAARRTTQPPPAQRAEAPAMTQAPMSGNQPPASGNAPPQASQAPPPPAPKTQDTAALQQTREELVVLNSRVGGIQTSLQNLQRTQAASGLGLRGDMVQAASLMRSYMEGAAAALNAGDNGSARSFMEKAERQVEKLEKFLGR